MVPNPQPGSCTEVGPDPNTFWMGTAPWGTQLLTPAASVPALLQFPWYPSQHQGCKGSQIARFRAFEENIWTGGDFFFLPKAVNVSVKEGSLKDSRETKNEFSNQLRLICVTNFKEKLTKMFASKSFFPWIVS